MEKENVTTKRNPETLIRLVNGYKQDMLTEVSCYLVYDSWELTKDKLKERQQKHLNIVFKNNPISKEELDDFTSEQLKELGLAVWAEEGIELWLLPLTLVPLLDPELEVTAIDNTTAKLKDVDLDIRFGCIAYGIIKSK